MSLFFLFPIARKPLYEGQIEVQTGLVWSSEGYHGTHFMCYLCVVDSLSGTDTAQIYIYMYICKILYARLKWVYVPRSFVSLNQNIKKFLLTQELVEKISSVVDDSGLLDI